MGPSVGDAGLGAPVVVDTCWTEYLCTVDMESCRGHSELSSNTLLHRTKCDFRRSKCLDPILSKKNQCARGGRGHGGRSGGNAKGATEREACCFAAPDQQHMRPVHVHVSIALRGTGCPHSAN